jgi:hypothetical protein
MATVKKKSSIHLQWLSKESQPPTSYRVLLCFLNITASRHWPVGDIGGRGFIKLTQMNTRHQWKTLLWKTTMECKKRHISLVLFSKVLPFFNEE